MASKSAPATYLVEAALAEYGEKEIKGRRHNPRILEYFEAIQWPYEKSDEIPWCGVFMYFIAQAVGAETPRRDQAIAARGWLSVGEEVSEPQLGDLAIYYRGSKNGWEGHVGIFIRKISPKLDLILGGNQGDQVCIREYDSSKILGYRRLGWI